MSGRRGERVSDLLQEEVSQIIQRELGDPRLTFVTVMRVEMSPDMRYGRAMISVYGTEQEQDEALEALNHAAGYVRRLLAPRLRMRHIPEITFRLDRSAAHAESISRLLRDLEPELRAAARAEAGAKAEAAAAAATAAATSDSVDVDDHDERTVADKDTAR